MSPRLRLRIAATKGSTPRDAGTTMVVTTDGQEGTIGGGRLEWEAVAWARDLLERGESRGERRFSLGPELGQCCGGALTLVAEPDEPLPPGGAPLWIWGAGHVGRALVHTLASLPDWRITWIDTGPDRFPASIPAEVTRLVAVDPPRAAAHAPRQAHHLILTYSHEIDLALCHGLLTRGFASCGLIGSATKWARFRKRLAALGHGDAEISSIACPIGDPTLGKHPQAIAVGVAAALLTQAGTKEPGVARHG